MTRQIPTKPVHPDEARAFAGKAEEHLDAAKQSLRAERWTAAATLSVHAGINAVDAITGMRLQRRSSGHQHEQALALLKGIPESADARRHLGPLLRLKPKAEYDPTPVRRSDAEQAVRLAEALIAIARSLAARRPQE